MKIKTQSTVTITMTGAEAHSVAVTLFTASKHLDSEHFTPAASQLLAELQELPEEVD